MSADYLNSPFTSQGEKEYFLGNGKQNYAFKYAVQDLGLDFNNLSSIDGRVGSITRKYYFPVNSYITSIEGDKARYKFELPEIFGRSQSVLPSGSVFSAKESTPAGMKIPISILEYKDGGELPCSTAFIPGECLLDLLLWVK